MPEGAPCPISKDKNTSEILENSISRRFFLLVARSEEKDANLIAIDPGELAAPVRVSHSRKQQKKFLEGKTFDRAVDGQSSAGLRYILHGAGTPPSTVDCHHAGRSGALAS